MDIVGDPRNEKARHDWEEDMRHRGNHYKTCGHSHPNYDQEGELDEVFCDLMKDAMCMDVPCPLDGDINQEER